MVVNNEWRVVRTFVGCIVAGLDTDEAGNAISPQTRFRAIDGRISDAQLDAVQFELGRILGQNGRAPPKPSLDDTVEQWQRRWHEWLLHRDISLSEAVNELKRFLRERGYGF